MWYLLFENKKAHYSDWVKIQHLYSAVPAAVILSKIRLYILRLKVIHQNVTINKTQFRSLQYRQILPYNIFAITSDVSKRDGWVIGMTSKPQCSSLTESLSRKWSLRDKINSLSILLIYLRETLILFKFPHYLFSLRVGCWRKVMTVNKVFNILYKLIYFIQHIYCWTKITYKAWYLDSFT